MILQYIVITLVVLLGLEVLLSNTLFKLVLIKLMNMLTNRAFGFAFLFGVVVYKLVIKG